MVVQKITWRLARDQVVFLETAANLWASRLKANDFFAAFSWTFELERQCSTLRVSRKQNTVFPLWSVIKCSLFCRRNLTWRTRGPFLEGPDKFLHPESSSKISNLVITELYYSRMLNVNRGSLHTRSFSCIHLSVLRYRWTKNGFPGPKSSRGFRETGHWAPRDDLIHAWAPQKMRTWIHMIYSITCTEFGSRWFSGKSKVTWAAVDL